MEPVTALITLFILLGTLYFLLLRDTRPKNFPPGPRGVPILGNVFDLGRRGFIPALELAKTYGNILGFKTGSYWMVYINDPEDIREVLNRPEFASRHGFNVLHDKNVEDVNAGIVLAYGKQWTECRRFTLRTLRDFGFGKRSLEHIIQEEVTGLMSEFKKMEGQPISTQVKFNIAAFNVIWSIVAGQRFTLDDPRLMELITLLNDYMRTAFEGINFLSFIFPAFTQFRAKFSFLFSSKRIVFRAKLFDFFRATIKEHRARLEMGEQPRDFIEAYMLEESKKNEDGSASASFSGDQDDFQLIATLMDLFIAGGETTSTTMTWAFFLLAQHPKVQEKLYEEIIAAGASDRPVALSDRPSLIYAEATPSAVPHATSVDTTFKGFSIPKNTMILPNIYGAHFDEKTWGDPKVFRPERFLTQEGKTLKFNRHSNLMPFSWGKRICLGESLARDEFLLFLANSVRNFVISMPPDEPPHIFEGRFGLVTTPEPHRIVLRSR